MTLKAELFQESLANDARVFNNVPQNLETVLGGADWTYAQLLQKCGRQEDVQGGYPAYQPQGPIL